MGFGIGISRRKIHWQRRRLSFHDSKKDNVFSRYFYVGDIDSWIVSRPFIENSTAVVGCSHESNTAGRY